MVFIIIMVSGFVHILDINKKSDKVAEIVLVGIDYSDNKGDKHKHSCVIERI